ncbi:WD repeat and coiled-coil-containing protein-like [Littorina saxatilis]|uniref:WD repeat and coiled-coil-containing protein n=1 Tax=Littorina saxatilis TaxID=31220 RepID=A0AAN9GIL9_9CAEN
MELGKSKLRRNGINNLLNALHPDHGLIWTDGKGIYLAPVHLYRDQVEKAGSLRLGEFEYVQSVHWSCPVDHDACYMAAVHQQNVTVWRVSGAVPRLAFKQVRKINVHPIPQGCLWNPKCDVLCLLSRQQCSFYFRHTHNRGSFAFPSLEHEKISCGCWSPDGKRLVLCVGTALLIYTWTDLEANISEFVTTAWRIQSVSGSVTAIVPAANNSLVCASDLPLDALCKNNNLDVFVPPDGILGSHGATSVKDSLLNLQANPKTQVQDAAMLSLIQLRPGLQDPVVLASSVVPGLLSPDILHFQVESQCIAVGSNTQNMLQIFALLDNYLLPVDHVILEKDQRPKGICGLHASQMTGAYGVLVLVGKAEPTDPTFPSTNNTVPFTLSLRFFPTRPENAKQLPNGLSGSVKSTSSASLMKSESLREPKNKSSISDSHLHTRQASYKGERPDHRLKSPERGEPTISLTLAHVDSVGETHSKLVEEITDSPRSLVEEVDGSLKRVSSPSRDLEIEKVDFSQTSPQFNNTDLSKKYDLTQNGCENDRSVKAAASKSSTTTSSTAKTTKGTPHEQANGHSRDAEKPARDSTQKGESVSLERASSHRAKDGNTPLRPRDSLSPKPSRSSRERDGKQSVEDGVSVCSSFNSNDSNYDGLEKQIQQQRDQIEALQRRLEDLSVMVEDTACVFPVKYQKMTEPEAVSIQCVVGGARVSRKFLLDNGRLQLDPVRHAFGLLTVELILDGEPLVLGANVDGYIPMKFSAGTILQVTGIPVVYSPQMAHKSRSKEVPKP